LKKDEKKKCRKCLLLAEIEIPQGVESIGASAFASCFRLTAVKIPDSVRKLGDTAAVAYICKKS